MIYTYRLIEADSLNFICSWNAEGGSQTSPTHLNSPTHQQGSNKIRVMCNHAGEKKNLFERINSIRQYIPCKIVLQNLIILLI